MSLANCFSFFIVSLLFISTAHAQEDYRSGYLTAPEIQRVKAVKELLGDVDKSSMRETIKELEKTKHPQTNLEMREAMARTYTDIVKEIGVDGQKKKEWLYSMVCLNMAYLQFGGSQGKYGSTTELNRLIRQKLKEYLPADVLDRSGFLHTLQ